MNTVYKCWTFLTRRVMGVILTIPILFFMGVGINKGGEMAGIVYVPSLIYLFLMFAIYAGAKTLENAQFGKITFNGMETAGSRRADKRGPDGGSSEVRVQPGEGSSSPTPKG